MGLQPKSGVTGAQLRERARQNPSQSLSRLHCLPASRVRRTQVRACDSPAADQVPPAFSQLICAAVFAAGSG
jgi:hypothetical protein